MAKRKIKILKDNLEEIKERKKKEQNSKIYRRLLFLEMKAKGVSHKEIAFYLDVREETLSVWTNIFLEGGLSALCCLKYKGRRISPLEFVKEDMKEYVEKEEVFTLKQMQEKLRKQHGIFLKIAWIQRFCKKNSIFPTKKHD